MPAKSPEDVLGLEFDWLGSDAEGHVALFSTAGGGYAPEEFLQDTEVHDKAIAAILTLPPSTIARFAPELPSGYKNTWRLVAERGLFAYDSDFNGGPYRLVAAPLVPAHITELPSLVEPAAGSIRVCSETFVDLRLISADLLRCRPS